MLGLTQAFAALYLASLLMQLGSTLLMTYLALRLTAGGVAEFWGGALMAANALGMVVGGKVGQVLIGRVGHIRTYVACSGIICAAVLTHAFSEALPLWLLLRFVVGVAMMCQLMVVESWLNTVAPSHQRGKVMAAYMSVNFVALALGQWLILVGDTLGFVPFVMVSVMFSFALLPITLTPVDEPEPVEAPRLSLRDLYQTSPLGVAGALGSGLINGAFYGMGAVFAQGVGFSEAGVAAFMAATILGGAIFQWPVGHYSDRHDRRHVLLWVMVSYVNRRR